VLRTDEFRARLGSARLGSARLGSAKIMADLCGNTSNSLGRPPLPARAGGWCVLIDACRATAYCSGLSRQTGWHLITPRYVAQADDYFMVSISEVADGEVWNISRFWGVGGAVIRGLRRSYEGGSGFLSGLAPRPPHDVGAARAANSRPLPVTGFRREEQERHIAHARFP